MHSNSYTAVPTVMHSFLPRVKGDDYFLRNTPITWRRWLN